MEISMVAVVRVFKSNHSSEYLGARIWNMGCARPAKNLERQYQYRLRSCMRMQRTCPSITRAYDPLDESDLAVPA